MMKMRLLNVENGTARSIGDVTNCRRELERLDALKLNPPTLNIRSYGRLLLHPILFVLDDDVEHELKSL